MIDPETYISEGLKIVKALFDQGNLQAALGSCQELLKVNPYHRKVQKYLKNIEETIVEKNMEKVDSDIDQTMHLWKEGRYEDLMKIYSRLYQYAPNHKRLREFIAKLNQMFAKQQKNEMQTKAETMLRDISAQLEQKQFGNAIQACNELIRVDPLNAQAAVYLSKAKNELIEQKISENERIVDGGDFERALEFFDTLLAIDPENEKVKKLALRAKEHLAHQKAVAAKIHLNESIVRMKEFFKTAEYEKAIQACAEIDQLDPGNFTARIFRKKSEKTMRMESDAMIAKTLKETWTAMAPEISKNPEGFVKI